MNKESLHAVAEADGKSLQSSHSIGYAINTVMDYGNGRQVTISGTLPLNATITDFNIELDKIRTATNRQEAFVNKRNIEHTLAMARKTVASIEAVLVEYDKEMEKEMARLSEGERAKHSQTKSQIENMRAQALNYHTSKNEELARAKADIAKSEGLLASYEKEIGG